MFELPLRAVAILTSLLVLAGWSFFALDEVRSASDSSRAQIAGAEASRSADPTPDQERARERAHNGARELVDDVNDALLAPFAFLAEGSSSTWVRRTAPALVALLLYGFGTAFLARYARGRAT